MQESQFLHFPFCLIVAVKNIALVFYVYAMVFKIHISLITEAQNPFYFSIYMNNSFLLVFGIY